MGVIYLNGIPYAGGGGGGGGSTDYTTLIGKPTLNGVTLAEGQTIADLNAVDDSTLEIDENNHIKVRIIDNSQIQNLFN